MAHPAFPENGSSPGKELLIDTGPSTSSTMRTATEPGGPLKADADAHPRAAVRHGWVTTCELTEGTARRVNTQWMLPTLGVCSVVSWGVDF